MWVLTEVAFKGVTSGTRAGQSWPMDVYLRGNIWYKGRSVSAFVSILTGATSGTRGGQYRPLVLYSRGQHLVQEAVSLGFFLGQFRRPVGHQLFQA